MEPIHVYEPGPVRWVGMHHWLAWVLIYFTVVLAIWVAWKMTKIFFTPLHLPPGPPAPRPRWNPFCARCNTENLWRANFCKSCGLMLRSHADVLNWMDGQRQLLKKLSELETTGVVHLGPDEQMVYPTRTARSRRFTSARSQILSLRCPRRRRLRRAGNRGAPT